MSAPNPNWTRWIHASITKHYLDNVATVDFPCKIRQASDVNVPSWFELRIDGPEIGQFTANEWYLALEINILISTDKNSANMWQHETNCGVIQGHWGTSFEITKEGDEAGDDNTHVGCLQLQTGRDHSRELSNFGNIERNVPLLQSMSEAHYQMFL